MSSNQYTLWTLVLDFSLFKEYSRRTGNTKKGVGESLKLSHQGMDRKVCELFPAETEIMQSSNFKYERTGFLLDLKLRILKQMQPDYGIVKNILMKNDEL